MSLLGRIVTTSVFCRPEVTLRKALQQPRLCQASALHRPACGLVNPDIIPKDRPIILGRLGQDSWQSRGNRTRLVEVHVRSSQEPASRLTSFSKAGEWGQITTKEKGGNKKIGDRRKAMLSAEPIASEKGGPHS